MIESGALLDASLLAFAHGARVRMAVLLEPSGRVLAQHGFTRSVDLMSACALVAAIHASAEELGRQLGGLPFGPLHHAGGGRQLFLAPVRSDHRTMLLLAVFDAQSSLGMVRVFWNDFARAVGDTPAAPPAPRAADFERDLQHSLSTLFARN